MAPYQVASIESEVDMKFLPKPLRRGVVPVMHIEPTAERAYWGKHLERIGELAQKQKEYLGCCKASTEARRQAVEELAGEETNARKVLAKARGTYGGGTDPMFPKKCEIEGKPEAKVYTDGGVKSPERKWWSLGGSGYGGLVKATTRNSWRASRTRATPT